MNAQIESQSRSPGLALDPEARERSRLALLTLLATAPVHKIAMRDAARRAELGLATLYKYFGGKEAMVRAVVDPEMDALIEALDAASRREVGVKARFQAVLRAHLSFVRDRAEAARAVWLNLPAGVWTAEPESWRLRRRAVLAHILTNGVHDRSVRADFAPESLAELVLGALDGVIEASLREAEKIDPGRRAERMFAALWPVVSAD